MGPSSHPFGPGPIYITSAQPNALHARTQRGDKERGSGCLVSVGAGGFTGEKRGPEAGNLTHWGDVGGSAAAGGGREVPDVGHGDVEPFAEVRCPMSRVWGV